MPIPSGPGSFITLDDAKTELNIPATDTSQDVELQGFIDAAIEVIENIVGPVDAVQYTEPHAGYAPTVVLDRYPVISVDTVTEYDDTGTGVALADEPLGSTYTDLGYRPDLTIGTLTRTSGGADYRFKTQVVVTYTAGRAAVPPTVRQGTLELIRHMWETQRGDSTGRPIPGYDEETPQDFGVAYLVPNRVNELLAPYRKAPKS